VVFAAGLVAPSATTGRLCQRIGPLELAYALTVHKAQGSEFKKVFVILPRTCDAVSRAPLHGDYPLS